MKTKEKFLFPTILFTVAILFGGATYKMHSKLKSDSLSMRTPLGQKKLKERDYELHIQKLKVDSSSRVKDRKNVFLRVIFPNETIFEFGKNEAWVTEAKLSLDIDYKIDIKKDWIKDDEINYKLELVQDINILNKKTIQKTLVECNTFSKDLSVYNRSYQCFIPGEKTPLFTYRFAEKGVPAPGTKKKSIETVSLN